MRRFVPSARRLARALTADEHLADDATQEALLAAIARLGDLRDPRAFAAWFRTIVRTESLRVARRSGRASPAAVVEAASPEPGPEAAADAAERRLLVRAAVARLPATDRDVVEAFYFEHRSIAAAALALGVPVGTAKRRLHAARERLRAILGRDPRRAVAPDHEHDDADPDPHPRDAAAGHGETP